MNRCGNDEGYATVATAGITTAIVSLMLAVAAAGGHVANSHRAATAADLAAVAAATALYEGFDACAAARRTATLNGASVGACHLKGEDVIVTARIGIAEHSARAGPL
ncbi:Rv3654c family TadE-like protein [Corynebacterium mayonis]|uniref:Rv3654c family TadE-like protein n=1 Tax=Corynebacterium mayonis TaxID=3062461 RepID=UPI00314011BD